MLTIRTYFERDPFDGRNHLFANLAGRSLDALFLKAAIGTSSQEGLASTLRRASDAATPSALDIVLSEFLFVVFRVALQLAVTRVFVNIVFDVFATLLIHLAWLAAPTRMQFVVGVTAKSRVASNALGGVKDFVGRALVARNLDLCECLHQTSHLLDLTAAAFRATMTRAHGIGARQRHHQDHHNCMQSVRGSHNLTLPGFGRFVP